MTHDPVLIGYLGFVKQISDQYLQCDMVRLLFPTTQIPDKAPILQRIRDQLENADVKTATLMSRIFSEYGPTGIISSGSTHDDLIKTASAAQMRSLSFLPKGTQRNALEEMVSGILGNRDELARGARAFIPTLDRSDPKGRELAEELDAAYHDTFVREK
jgi:hypothetical protein